MKSATGTTRLWGAAEHLETPEEMAAYPEAALEDGDPALVAAALGDIARAKGMTQRSRDTGPARGSLHKALSSNGHPAFATMLKAVQTAGMRLWATTA